MRTLIGLALASLALPAAARDCVPGIAPAGVTVTEAAATPATDEIPVAHCLIRARMAERTGTDGKPYAISFELRLPDDWSGRFVHQFNGGNDGRVVPALGARDELAPGDSALARGFAVVSSDAGHDGAANPEAGLAGSNLFGLEFEARRAYGYTAVAQLHPVALAMVEAHYGRAPDFVYGMGASNGGRHAMIAAVRMPGAFDGLLIGFPGFNLPKAAIQHAWDVQTFRSVGPSLAEAFSREELAIVADAVRAACDGLDGLEDGIVFATMACQTAFDPATMTCAAGQNSACLPAEKVAALVRIHAGPTDSAGRQLYSPWAWDTGIASNNWRFWKLESPVPPWEKRPVIAVMGAGSLAQVFTTPPTPVEGTPDKLEAFLMGFDFDRDAPKIFATSAEHPESAMEVITPPGADDPVLAEFQAAGGKLIVWHGVSDPVFSFLDTAAWFDRLSTNNPKAAEFARLYAVPGMPHGQGGVSADEFDLLTALTGWVEDGTAPGPVAATVRTDSKEAPEAIKGATRPLCPWPTVATHTGGDPAQAASFACR